ncbi:hypothetical protein AAY473_036845 [Plecturocebus cupreus]
MKFQSETASVELPVHSGEMGFCLVAQAGLELLSSSSSPALASQSSGITGVSCQAQPIHNRFKHSVFIAST